MLIGIAGLIGSGKSHAAAKLEERGWRTLDLDLVAHRVLEGSANEVEAALGPGLLTEDGKVNKPTLANIVFSSPDHLARLEAITYPRIERETLNWIDQPDPRPAAVHAVNLHKTALPELCALIIWVYAPFIIRRRRVISRDSRPWSSLKARFRSQKALNPKLFSGRAETYSVGNCGNDKRLEAALNRILGRLQTYSAEREGNSVKE